MARTVEPDAFALATMPRSKPPRKPATPTFSNLIEENYLALRRIAQRTLRDRTAVQKMSPTSLVAEMTLRMLAQRTKPVSIEQFRGLATVFMTRAVADDARHRLRVKRGSGKREASADERESAASSNGRLPAGIANSPVDPLLVGDPLLRAMEDVARREPRQMEVITLHLVAGIPIERTAQLIGISIRSAYRDLEEGRAALARALNGSSSRKSRCRA